MDVFWICLTALTASIMTFFSGFGLGTILLPVFAIYFPIDIAITLTAFVHLSNNLFKFALLGKFVDKSVVVRFGLPSIIFALLGAFLLSYLSNLQEITHWEWLGIQAKVTPIKLIIGVLVIVFSIFEFSNPFKVEKSSKTLMFMGASLSGFIGGISGHQGMLRTLFLKNVGLSKESFLATGIAIACLVDISRLAVYKNNLSSLQTDTLLTLFFATLAAISGAVIGNKIFKKITLKFLQTFVGIFLIAFGLLIAIGLL